MAKLLGVIGLVGLCWLFWVESERKPTPAPTLAPAAVIQPEAERPYVPTGKRWMGS